MLSDHEYQELKIPFIEENLRQKKQALIDRINSVFNSDFLAADNYWKSDPDSELLSDTEYRQQKAKFTQNWAKREKLPSPNIDLDIEQAAAVAAYGGDIQIIARAGSGKTGTLVTRALFLQKHCGVLPSNLLLLAFNSDAALKIRNALNRVLKGNLPHIMTFHALANALVNTLGSSEKIICDEPSAGNLGLSQEIQSVIDEHLQSEKYRSLIRDLMLMHFRDDWERIVDGGFHMPIDELIDYRRSLPRETLGGEYVKSFGEKLIANTLFENDIKYKYEKNFRWNGVNYKPDFTIPMPNHCGVVIEYFGLSGDPDYDQMSEEKRNYWHHKEGWTFIEFSPMDITSRGTYNFSVRLVQKLKQVGIRVNHLTDAEIWERIRKRAIDNFTKAMRSFVSRCRKRNLSPEDLQKIVSLHEPISEAEGLFLKVGGSIYLGYLQKLKKNHHDDFDGLMLRAVKLLKSGVSKFVRDKQKERGDLRNIRFVLIDEFQDFSELFFKLVEGIRSLNPNAEFFCVGDDWQAINAFAGSELRFFDNFEIYFHDTTKLHVSTNYRSHVKIVEIGNALMNGRGKPAVAYEKDAGRVKTARLSEFVPTAAEKERHNGDDATPALLRIVKHLFDSGSKDVVMLSRRNRVPWYVSYKSGLPDKIDGLERFAEHIRSFLPAVDGRRVTASTAHSYKGLDKAAVVVLDADEGSYPLIHPTWMFLRVFGDSVKRIEDEERRLFYVALTRARHSLVIISNDLKHASRYLGDIQKTMNLEQIVWSDLPPVKSIDGERVNVLISNAYEARYKLEELGYEWNQKEKCRQRSFLAKDFDFEALCSEPWMQNSVRIEVYSEDGKLLKKKDN
jgi:DNA helicase-4